MEKKLIDLKSKDKDSILAPYVLNELFSLGTESEISERRAEIIARAVELGWEESKALEFCKDYRSYIFPEAQKAEKEANIQKTVIPGLVCVDSIEEKEPEWLVTGYIPRNNICVLGGDGGSGKTTIWCNIVSAVSNGTKCILEHDIPDDFARREPGKVVFFSSEDSISYTLKARLKKSGANMKNIFSVSLENNETFSQIKLNSPMLENIIAEIKPELVVFDPLQSFIPEDIQMGSRNAMRSVINPLIGLAEKYKVTFIIVMHTNKKVGVSGRNRLADSSDIWDISRSVLIAGNTNDGMHYVSHEKSNYSTMSDTVLFKINDGAAEFFSTTEKKDRDFVSEFDYTVRSRPERNQAKETIIEYLSGGKKMVSELDDYAAANNITKATLRRAKEELKADKKTRTWSEGNGKEKKWYIGLLESGNK